MEAGADIAVQTLHDIESGTVQTLPQPEAANLKPAPKIFKEDMLICWDDTAENIYNKIRGLSPYPTAYTRIMAQPATEGEPEKVFHIKVYQASVTDIASTSKPGTITLENNKKMLVSSKNREISIEILQFEGKKRMNIADFLAGFRKNNYTDLLF